MLELRVLTLEKPAVVDKINVHWIPSETVQLRAALICEKTTVSSIILEDWESQIKNINKLKSGLLLVYCFIPCYETLNTRYSFNRDYFLFSQIFSPTPELGRIIVYF